MGRLGLGIGPALLWGAAALAFACGGQRVAAPAPEASTPPALPVTEEPAPVLAEPPEDSAADQAALTALQELEFKGLGKGETQARGVLPVPAAVGDREVNTEASRLFDGAGGGAASAAGVTWDIDVESFAARSRVLYYMNFFQIDSRDRFTIWLGRLRRYEGMIRSRFKSYGVPEDLVYLGLIESGYSNTAVSRAKAVGMWQFMTYTAQRYGLQVDQWVDDRRDPFKATDAAAQHLRDLDSMFGSWYLAAAAYNGGTGRVMRGIKRLPGEPEELTDETFFSLAARRYLRPETRDYVPKLIAAALIAKDPRRFGFDETPDLEPLVFDEITVPDATGLDVIARLADTTTGALLELNPQYYRGVTPPRRSAIVRVPRGTGTAVAQRYLELPASERVNFLEHVVTRGETLSEIAQRYRVSVDLLLAANPGVKARALRVGARLKIPVSAAARGVARRPTSRARQASSAAPAASPVAASGTVHVVKPGETLWLLSQRYGATVAALRRWNGMSAGEVLRVGQRLIVAPPTDDGSR
jgi:membrane-bound lytic murein transglycosylase D